ncbi:AfsR/SARP family transcriptional regulator [Rugosimonospora africana]|uniref:AfsR/SARP family transcriptional regulator n=1 Tax=Rugosimonospora africana TaxID=556532 RepID=UPI001940CEB4|nr:BTAD domain-containing putative transcriptional regulator [Rugosimonospora africana]
MRLGLLGPLLVLDETGREVTLPAARQRVLLAALALRANQVVPGETLTELVWDGSLPNAAAVTLRSYIRRLRQALGPAWAARIVTRAPGYLCLADEQELDVLAFEALCCQAGAALREQRWAQASDAAGQALSLWRGAPLLDAPSQMLRDAFVPRLDQVRVQVLEDQAEADLRLGRHERLVQPLRELVAQHPLRERFHIQLMLALACSGRRAEALTAYQEARKTLVAELGIEPGPELRTLHERILASDELRPEATPSGDHAPEPSPTTTAPRQLPAATRQFTGRSAELAWLTGLAPRAKPHGGTGGTVLICAIDGMAGIGKTALAVDAAHRVSGRFPDGQLFVDLHGYTKGYPPREPGDALSMLLRALEVPAQRIPEDTEERAALYRQCLTGTRTLIVLDNAHDEAQVRPLLPGEPGCLVLLTSRRRLKGLHDATVLALDVLPEPDALALLRTMLAPARSTADDLVLREIVELCGRLPLALRIAGALLRHRPHWTPQHLAALLRDQQRRMAPLTDGEHDLHAVFNLSYTKLDEQHQLLLRRLALIPGPDLGPYAAAALLDVDPHTATELLEDLVDHNLLLAHAPGRYRLHDLIRAHARTLAQRDPADERAATLDRLLHYYAHTAHTASIPLARYPRPAPDSAVPTHTPALPGPEAGRAWLRAERENLEAAYASGRDENGVALAAGLAEILRSDGPLDQARDMLQGAADTAHRHGHHAACATALTDLGIVRRLSGDLRGAGDALARSLEICRQIGHRSGEASALSELGMVELFGGDAAGAGDAAARAVTIFQEIGHRSGEATALIHWGVARRLAGDLSASSDALSRALEICRQIGHRSGEASALAEFGAARRMAGDLPAAANAHLQALKICREIGHRDGQATVLAELGIVRRLAGDLPGADDALTQALEIYRQFGHRPGEAHALTELGRVRHMAGDTPAATEAIHQALDIFRANGNRNNEAWALNHYAAAIAATGDLPQALALYRQALTMNRELNKPDDEARSLEGLGECHLTAGETEPAITHLRQALHIYQRHGMTLDADRVRNCLTDLKT